jgi:hypothetical protein
MFWGRLYNWLWQTELDRECYRRDLELEEAAMTRPLTGDEPRTFFEFVRRVLGL